ENMPQPDASLILEPACGGQVKLSPDDYIVGAPEWVGEVSASTVSLDLNKKLRVYRRNNVLEYLVWRVMDREVDWFVLCGSDYERLPLMSTGLYQSKIFSGLWLDPAALARRDMAAVLRVIQQGTQSAEHAEFVARLQHGRTSHRQHPIKKFLKILGPGLITGASDDDPSGIGTYAMAGAALGYSALWMAIATFPLMTAVQFICAKVGMVTGTGLGGV